jgi:hypothetical protein
VRRALGVLGALLVAGVAAFVVERLIVTDAEAILEAAERSADACARGDAAEAMRVLHPSAVTEFGNPERTRAVLEENLRRMPLKKVNFIVNDLAVENGVGKMSLKVIVLPRDPNKAGSAIFEVPMSVEWRKDGEEWKVRRADIR